MPGRVRSRRAASHAGRQRMMERQRLLADAGIVLASSLDYEQTLRSVAELAVPVVADWCAVDLANDDRMRPVTIVHRDPTKVELALELRRRYRLSPTAPYGIRHVLSSGQPDLFEHITEELLEEMARDERHLAVLRSLGLCSAMIVPLIARGRVLGVMSLVSAESGRCFTRADLDFAEELALRVAVAIDNATLYRQAQEAVKARDEMLAIVSHDLRNPLDTIYLAATLLANKLEHQRETGLGRQAETILRCSGRMRRLIEDLLDLANIQTGRLTVHRRVEEARSILEEAANANAPLAADTGVQLVSAVDLDGLSVECDRGRILQVLSNLIGNAIKACQPGAQVAIHARATSSTLLVDVADTGRGISTEDLPHLFEPYWTRGDRHMSGTGLGLYICRGIIEAHGGRIWAESAPGEGSTFTFTLPLAPAARTSRGHAPAQTAM